MRVRVVTLIDGSLAAWIIPRVKMLDCGLVHRSLEPDLADIDIYVDLSEHTVRIVGEDEGDGLFVEVYERNSRPDPSTEEAEMWALLDGRTAATVVLTEAERILKEAKGAS